MIYDALILAVIMAICWAGGYFYAHYSMLHNVKQFYNSVNNKIAQTETTDNASEDIVRDGIMLVHEHINNVHYFFDKESNAFVCQGASLDDAAGAFCRLDAKLVAMFKNIIDNQYYCFIDGKVVIADQDVET
jgi:hypothetical protein